MTTDGRNSLLAIIAPFKTTSTFTGPLFTIRRDSDDETSDFYPTDYIGGLATSSSVSFTDWIGSSNGYVQNWYDQSGFGNNAYQTNTALQPILNIDQLYVDFTANSGAAYMNMIDAPAVPVGNHEYTYTAKHGAIYNSKGGIMGFGPVSNDNSINLRRDIEATSYREYWYGDDFVFAPYAANSIVTMVYNLTTRAAYVNGTLAGTEVASGNLNRIQESTGVLGATINDMILNGQLYYFFSSNIVLSDYDRDIWNAVTINSPTSMPSKYSNRQQKKTTRLKPKVCKICRSR